jgi:endonuclease/exonuclease/phosphatase (EEP) superfamily protein YafD
VIAGDLGAVPGSPVIDRLQAAGLVSAQDSAGGGGMRSWPASHPRYRPDWIFGTDDVSFTGFAMPHSRASDHFPLAVTASVG